MDVALYRKLMPIFLAEAHERLQAMDHALAALAEDAFDIEARDELARAAHTIRGNATALGLRLLMQEAERLERWALLPPTALTGAMLEALTRARATLEELLHELDAEPATEPA